MELRYKQIGDYLYPDLKMPEQTNYEIGKYGRMRFLSIGAGLTPRF